VLTPKERALTGGEDDAGVDDLDQAGPAAPNPAATVSRTQPLPMVRYEGLTPPAQPARAVARRVPSALPAIGRDEITDVPASARANADRRRRAREAAAGTESDPQSDGE
jgi:hypothetical protein